MSVRNAESPLTLLFVAGLLALLPGPLDGQQTARYVHAFVGVKTPADMEGDGRTVEKKLVSELVRLGATENFSVVTPKNRDVLLEKLPVGAAGASRRASLLPSDGLPSARSLIIGDLGRFGEGLRLRVDILWTETLETRNSAAAVSRDLDHLLGDITRLLHALFDLPDPQALHLPQPPDLAALPELPPSDGMKPPAWEPVPVLADLAGTWKKEGSAESVLIRTDGSAAADLGGRTELRLAVSIEDGKVVARQDEPNSPGLYLDRFSYSTAVRAAELARPLRWVLVLSRDKKRLTGIRESAFFVVDAGEVLSVDNSFVQEEVWLKVP